MKLPMLLYQSLHTNVRTIIMLIKAIYSRSESAHSKNRSADNISFDNQRICFKSSIIQDIGSNIIYFHHYKFLCNAPFFSDTLLTSMLLTRAKYSKNEAANFSSLVPCFSIIMSCRI